MQPVACKVLLRMDDMDEQSALLSMSSPVIEPLIKEASLMASLRQGGTGHAERRVPHRCQDFFLVLPILF